MTSAGWKATAQPIPPLLAYCQRITDLATFRKELGITRRRGYAIDQQESVLGARCVAVPVLSPQKTAVAAISVSGPVTRMGLDKVKLFAATGAARDISRRIYGE